MPRAANAKQELDEFVFLGHKPYEHFFPQSIGGVSSIMMCSDCMSAVGSMDGCNPCGDRLGSSIKRISPQVVYMYKNKVLS